MSSPVRAWPLLAAAATGVQVGAAIAASRLVVTEVPPLTLAFLRYAIGFLCLLPLVLRHFWPPAPVDIGPPAIKSIAFDLGGMAALGVVQFALVIALLNFGLQTVAAAPAALIFSLFPLLTLMFSAALGHERITPSLLGGVVMSISGVALSLAPKLTAPHTGHWWGEAAVLLAAALGAACSVLYRPYLRRYPTLPVSAWAMLASVLFLGALAPSESAWDRVLALTPGSWAVVVFIGVSSGVGYALWLYALKHAPATRVTAFLALNPLTAALLGSWWLGEPAGATAPPAIALIAAGLWLATRAPAPVPRG